MSKKMSAGKKIRIILFVVVGMVFLGSLGYILYTNLGYKKEASVYSDVIAQAIIAKPKKPSEGSGNGASGSENGSQEEGIIEDDSPFDIDFEVLWSINPDICGWIYCPDTVINYPILKGANNDTYIRHNYLKDYATSGSIFIEMANSADFSNSNTIVYGHNMRDGSMFACLSKWSSQDFYNEHPYMYLFTPKKTYRIELFSEYITDATSDSYYAILSPCQEMNDYLARVKAKSNFNSEVELDPNGRYVMLSTCSYAFENARFVLHGKLVEIEDINS